MTVSIKAVFAAWRDGCGFATAADAFAAGAAYQQKLDAQICRDEESRARSLALTGPANLCEVLALRIEGSTAP